MENPTEQKESLRQHYREIRKSIPEEQRWAADADIVARACGLDAFKNSEAVFTYLSVDTEVETRGIIQQCWLDGKLVALPRCVPGCRQMTWHAVTSLEGLERAYYGAWEPRPDASTLVDPFRTNHSLAIVPGLTFDELGYRLGYGGGYYDVFLGEFAGLSMGLCREASLSREPLRIDFYDVSVDIVVTEKRILGLTALGMGEGD